MDSLFKTDFNFISGDYLNLRLIDTFDGGNGELPFYWWSILLPPDNIEIGKISLRLGHNYHSYYNGNIGYEIDNEYRGHHYALIACKMVLDVARQHGMGKLYLTCDYDNYASYKTIERLNADFVEEVIPPRDYIFFHEGIKKHKIYLLAL